LFKNWLHDRLHNRLLNEDRLSLHNWLLYNDWLSHWLRYLNHGLNDRLLNRRNDFSAMIENNFSKLNACHLAVVV
jgi:hypothetical protein